MHPYRLEEEEKVFNKFKSIREKNVYQYLSKHATFVSDDKEGERSNLYKSAHNLLEKIANCKNVSLLHLFNTLDDESIGKFLLSSIEDKRNSIARTSFANLKKSYEVDIRECIDGKYTMSDQNEFFNFWIEECNSSDDPIYANHAFFVANYFTYLLNEHSSYTKRRLFPPKSILLDNYETESLSDLYFYLESVIHCIMGPVPFFCFDYIYKPYDLFYMLVFNASEDLVRQVDNCFDYFALHEKNLENLSVFKNKIDDLINKYEIIIKPLSTKYNYSIDIHNFDCINTKINRDSIFNSISFLCEAKNTANEFSILNKKDLDDKSKALYYKEGQTKPTDFEGNLQNTHNFLNTYPFYENNHVITDKGLPTIGLIFEKDSIILEKVLFHEFMVGHSEHRNQQIHGITSSHSKSLLQSKLTTLLDRIICNLNNPSKDSPDFDNKNRGIFDSVKVSIDKNTRNTDLYTLSVYMTEKIRRGYYREYQMMDWYKTSFQTSSKLKELFLKLLYIRDISKSISILYHFSLEVDSFLATYLKSDDCGAINLDGVR